MKILEACKKVSSGGTPLRSNLSYYENGTIPWLKTGEVKKEFIYDTEEKITEVGLQNSSAKLIPKNSVIIAMYGDGNTAGHVAINKVDLATNQACCNLIVDDKIIYYKYLYYYLKGSYQNLINLKLGGSQQNLNATTIKNIEIIVLPLQIQKKIAAVLSAYDDLVENNHRRIAILEKMAEEIYKEWFVRMRFPDHQTSKFNKGIPEGWEVKSLDELCKEIRNGAKIKDIKPGTKYIGLEHIPRKSISLNNYADISTVNSNKLLFDKRDILFGKIRPYLHKVSIAGFSGACSSDTIVIRPHKGNLEGFIFFTIFSETFIELATAASKGTKMPRADWDFLKKLELKTPPKELLNKYQSLIENITNEIFVKHDTNFNLKQTRDRLLTRLISGKLSVEDLDIQFPHSMKE
jgi:type I restriction enzyme, S subunit